MNEKDYIRSLQALHAGKLELARLPQDFAKGIMGLADDVLADATESADGKTEFGGESLEAIVARILAQKAGEYLAGVEAAAPKEAPAPEPEFNDSLKAFRDSMKGGKS